MTTANIKRRINNLETALSERRDHAPKCAVCGTVHPPFDQDLHDTLTEDEKYIHLLTHYCGPCAQCGAESEMGRQLRITYGDETNSLSE